MRQNPIVHSDIDYLKALIVNSMASPQLSLSGYNPQGLTIADADLFQKIINDIAEDYPQHRNYGKFLYDRLMQTGLTGHSLLYVPHKYAQYEQFQQKQLEDQVLRDILDFLSRFDRWKLTSKVVQKQLTTPKTFHIMPGIELQLTAQLNTRDFLEWFDIDVPEGEFWSFIQVDDYDLADNHLLNLTYDDGVLYDANDEEIEQDIVDEIVEAVRWAIESDAQNKVWEAVKDVIAEICMTFQNVGYEFWYIPAEDIGVSQDYAEGIAKGIQTVDVTGDYVTIKTYPDLCLEIANCIYGYGMFHAIEDEWKHNSKEYIETRFHHLKHYWSIYGERKPKLDLDFQQDIDEEYFKELITNIEFQTGLQLQ